MEKSLPEMHYAHKIWILAIAALTTWGLLFLAFCVGSLTWERLRRWGALLSFTCLGAWIVFVAMNDSHADVVFAFALSLNAAIFLAIIKSNKRNRS